MAPLLTQTARTMASAIEHLPFLGLRLLPRLREGSEKGTSYCRFSKPRVVVFGRGNVSAWAILFLHCCVGRVSFDVFRRKAVGVDADTMTSKEWDCCFLDPLSQLQLEPQRRHGKADGRLLLGSKLADEWEVMYFLLCLGRTCCWEGWG